MACRTNLWIKVLRWRLRLARATESLWMEVAQDRLAYVHSSGLVQAAVDDDCVY